MASPASLPPMSEDLRMDALAARMLGEIERRPGACYNDLRRALGISWDAFRAALARLETRGAIQIHRARRRCAVYPAGHAIAHEDLARLAALALDGRRRVAERLLEMPHADVLQLAAATGFAPRTVYHHVARLARLGLVREARGPHGKRVVPEPALARLVRAGAQPSSGKTLLPGP